jgi:hypothetical protein
MGLQSCSLWLFFQSNITLKETLSENKDMPKYYVQMHDTFMSGWGKAEGLKNIYQVECDSYPQALRIQHSAQKRDEMKDITIRNTALKSDEHTLVSHRHFNDLGTVWTGPKTGE